MSTHAFTLGADASAATARIVMACHDAGRAPVAATLSGTNLTLEFSPDLGAAAVARLEEIVRAARSSLGLSPDERNALETEIVGLRTYLGVATPTAAQTALATKAIIRVLRAVLRD